MQVARALAYIFFALVLLNYSMEGPTSNSEVQHENKSIMPHFSIGLHFYVLL